MGDDIDALRAEVAALRAELQEQRDDKASLTRRRLLTGLAGLGAASAASIATAPSANAADGDPLLIGQTNNATNSTLLTGGAGNESEPLLSIHSLNSRGLEAIGQSFGVEARGRVAVAAISEEHSALNGWAIGTATGVKVTSEAVGAHLQGTVPLVLVPTLAPGPPSTTQFVEAGSMSVDSAKDIWLCTASGAPGTWTRLLREDTTSGRVIPITPFRALDTRGTGGRPSGGVVITGQRRGPIRGGETITLRLREHAAIPATATGVFGSLCVVTPSYTGSCRVLPSGTSTPASAVNFWKGVGALSNSYVCRLGTAGLSLKPSGNSSHTTHLILDVAGYLT